MKKFLAVLMASVFVCLTGCGSEEAENTEINVFIAASLNGAMTEIVQNYNAIHPDVTVNLSPDSSGKLATQIKEGADCDIFFSAAQDKMDDLEDAGLIKSGSRKNVVNNQVVVVALKGSDTKVTGLANIGDAESIALADGSVPVGAYTRTALMNLGILPDGDAKSITTQEVSDALGGVEISEQENVSKVLTAVAEGACEVGTTYYSDTYGYEDKVEVLETVSNELTGDVIYPIALTVNNGADIMETETAQEFLAYVTSDEGKAVFDKYYFDTDVD
jgi:molybdate transport system substrate-binding protein